MPKTFNLVFVWDGQCRNFILATWLVLDHALYLGATAEVMEGIQPSQRHSVLQRP